MVVRNWLQVNKLKSLEQKASVTNPNGALQPSRLLLHGGHSSACEFGSDTLRLCGGCRILLTPVHPEQALGCLKQAGKTAAVLVLEALCCTCESQVCAFCAEMVPPIVQEEEVER